MKTAFNQGDNMMLIWIQKINIGSYWCRLEIEYYNLNSILLTESRYYNNSIVRLLQNF